MPFPANYSTLTNISNRTNINNTRMNELLSKIGTDSKSFYNKMTLKKSKSDEFLDIVERKLRRINLMDIRKDSIDVIEKKINELEKIFTKLKDFSEKIQRKNNPELKDRLSRIYWDNKNIFQVFLHHIQLKAEQNSDIENLRKLKTHVDKLIKLNNLIGLRDQKILQNIEMKKNIINKKINSLQKSQQPNSQTKLLVLNNTQNSQQPNSQTKLLVLNNTQKLTDEYEKLIKNLMINKNNIRKINNDEKTSLSEYMKDLYSRIHENMLITKNLNNLSKLSSMWLDVHNKYWSIFRDSIRKPLILNIKKNK